MGGWVREEEKRARSFIHSFIHSYMYSSSSSKKEEERMEEEEEEEEEEDTVRYSRENRQVSLPFTPSAK